MSLFSLSLLNPHLFFPSLYGRFPSLRLSFRFSVSFHLVMDIRLFVSLLLRILVCIALLGVLFLVGMRERLAKILFE